MAYNQQLADKVRMLMMAREGYSERKMFGGICYMINGNMACGVVKDDLMLRIGPDNAEKALKNQHVREMDFTGRPMKGMVYVEQSGWESDLETWVGFAAEWARSLPPKKKK